MVLQWTLPWPYNAPNMALYILAIFLHSMQQKWVQGTQGTHRSTLIGSRTHLGSSMDPAMAVKYTQHGPFYIGYIFAFYANKMRSRDSGDIKVSPHWVQDPPWSFNGPCHWPSIHLTWPYNTPNMAHYILAIFLHSMPQKWYQGTLGTHRLTPIGSRTRLGPSMDPAMALLYCIVGPWQGPWKDQGGFQTQ